MDVRKYLAGVCSVAERRAIAKKTAIEGSNTTPVGNAPIIEALRLEIIRIEVEVNKFWEKLGLGCAAVLNFCN